MIKHWFQNEYLTNRASWRILDIFVIMEFHLVRNRSRVYYSIVIAFLKLRIRITNNGTYLTDGMTWFQNCCSSKIKNNKINAWLGRRHDVRCELWLLMSKTRRLDWAALSQQLETPDQSLQKTAVVRRKYHDPWWRVLAVNDIARRVQWIRTSYSG